MGQGSRISLSLMLITALGCGQFPQQTRVRSQEQERSEAAPSLFALSEDAFDLSMGAHDHDLVPETLTDHVDDTALGVSDDALSVGLSEPPSVDAAPRVLRLFDLNDRTFFELAVHEDGSVAESDRLQVEHFFRCRRTQKTHAMAAGVLKILYAVDRKFPGHVLEIVSGFRTHPFGVRESKHFEGHAIDLRLRGVRTTRVRDFVWKHFADVGVGYYGHGNFVHVDYRPEEKDAAWTSPEPNAAYAYNPGWALRIRPPWRAPRALDLTGATASR